MKPRVVLLPVLSMSQHDYPFGLDLAVRPALAQDLPRLEAVPDAVFSYSFPELRDKLFAGEFHGAL